jgi:tripartite ATP-independent transporter DctM subunit
MEIISLFMFLVVCIVLLTGYPVAFSLAGTGLIFALAGAAFDLFPLSELEFIPNRLYGIMNNTTLIAVPLFVFMGIMLEKSKVAENLLETMSALFGATRGGLGVSVVIVGMLLAASTGIVGATVVTMGLLSLPAMLKRNYDPKVAAGLICASGTLGQIIPPSIVLVLLGDQLSTAYTLSQAIPTKTVSVGDLFVGAIFPGLLLVFLYCLYLLFLAQIKPDCMPAVTENKNQQRNLGKRIASALLPPLFLMVAVLGSIISGAATMTEAASVGAIGAIILAIQQGTFSFSVLQDTAQRTLRVTSMVFMILIGANIFSVVFRGYGGDELITQFLSDLPGGAFSAMLIVMLVMFLLGFILDFIEITFVVVPLVAPVLLGMGLDPVWLGIMIALNLQTSFLTPPFGFALFYLRGVAPKSVTTQHIYSGVLPFIGIQLLVISLLAFWPPLATWLPSHIN